MGIVPFKKSSNCVKIVVGTIDSLFDFFTVCGHCFSLSQQEQEKK